MVTRTARGLYEGIWLNAQKDLAAVARLAAKVEKKPEAADGIPQLVKKFKGLPLWLALAFDEGDRQVDDALDALKVVRASSSAADLLAFRDRLRDLAPLVAPARFSYGGFTVINDDHISDKLCRKTLSGVDYLIALFKRRNVPDLLRSGVTDIRILPGDPLKVHAGAYNMETRTITLETPNDKSSSGNTFIEKMCHVFLHEFGHHVHLNYLHPEAVKAWNDPWDAGEEPTSVSPYGRKSKEEDFAENVRRLHGGAGEAQPRVEVPDAACAVSVGLLRQGSHEARLRLRSPSVSADPGQVVRRSRLPSRPFVGDVPPVRAHECGDPSPVAANAH